jgi:hypothetical protein
MQVIVSLIIAIYWVKGITQRKKKQLIFPIVIFVTFFIICIFSENGMYTANRMGVTLLLISLFNICYSYISKNKKGDLRIIEIRLSGYIMFITSIFMLLLH